MSFVLMPGGIPRPGMQIQKPTASLPTPCPPGLALLRYSEQPLLFISSEGRYRITEDGVRVDTVGR